MIDFRSPWLAHLPQIKVENRLARQSVRLVLAGSVGFLLLILLLLIWQPTARNGPVYLLYWLHDRLFLPFKAYTYTIFFPASLIWWGIAATIFSLWLVSFLSDRSLLVQPHLWLLRFAIHQPGLHPVLVGSARHLKKYDLKAALLKNVTEHERALACSHLGEQLATGADPTALRAAVGFTKLQVQLHAAPVSALVDQLYAAALWVETLSLLFILAIPGKHEADNLKSALLAELADCAGLILAGLPGHAHAAGPEQTLHSPFAPATFGADFSLICCSQPLIARHHLGADRAATLDSYRVKSHLVRSVARRRLLLDQMRQHLESDRVRNSLSPGAATDGLGFPRTATPAANELALMGQLSLGIALYTAALGAAPEVALSYLDTIETVGFALAFAPGLRSAEPPVQRQLAALVGGLPTALDYRIAALLQTRHLDARRLAWVDSPFNHEELILPADFDLAGNQVAALLHAAGPPPAAANFVSHERAWVGNTVAQLQRLGPLYALWRQHAPVYSARAGERLAAYSHTLAGQAGALYQKVGGNKELSNRVETVRTQANHWRQQSTDQVRGLYARYIASGQASTFLVEQWRRCRSYLDALQKRWWDKE
jgi:hypothetical protein